MPQPKQLTSNVTGQGRYLRGLLAVVVCLVTLSTPLRAESCPPGQNLLDTDDNGLFDYACVGDWNDNGTCEMEEDIQAAILALDDPGPKMVSIDECSFTPPIVAADRHGILVLPDNITLAGQGPGTLLNGFAATDEQSPQAVITNDDHVDGNSNILIRDLRIYGGWHGGNALGLPHARMGIRFTTCTNCRVERLEVSDTLHACLYASNSNHVEFLDSDLQRCGNLGGLGLRFPCVYLYAYGGGETRDVVVRGIDCDQSGHSAIATRRQNTDSTLNDLVFEDNTLRNTQDFFDGLRMPCITISGVGSAQFLNNTCINTGGFESTSTGSYYSEGLDVNASANITVDGLSVTSSAVHPPIIIRPYAEDYTLRNITVDGVAGSHCMTFGIPLRGFSLDGAVYSNCGELGIHQSNLVAAGTTEDETLTFRNIEITSVGMESPSEGLHFRGPMKGLLLDNVSVDGATSHGVRFDSLIEDSTISNLTISNTTGHGIYLNGDTRNVSLAAIDINVAGSDCILLQGSLTPAVSHEQLSITESTLANCAGHGIAIKPNYRVVQDLELADNVIDDVDGDGIELALDDLPSGNVQVHHNTIRNFGRSADGDANYGIQLSGTLTGEIVSQNSLDDRNDQAMNGIFHDVPGSRPTYLCSNSCIGTLLPTECLRVTENTSYETDSDGDGTVDSCEDDDEDGIVDPDDNCPDVSNPLQTETDQDGIGDACDNCVSDYNPAQADLDSDFEGDLCDLNDGLIYVRYGVDGSMDWHLEKGFDKWNVYRGDLAILAADGAYTQPPGSNPLAGRICRLNTPPVSDENPAQPDRAAFYLVTGIDGTAEGDLGHDSSGQLRRNEYPCADDLPAMTK